MDLSDVVCPLSKIRAMELIDSLDGGEVAGIVLGDTDSLKRVAQELKDRALKPAFETEGENRFVLTVTKIATYSV